MPGPCDGIIWAMGRYRRSRYRSILFQVYVQGSAIGQGELSGCGNCDQPGNEGDAEEHTDER